MAYLVVTAPDGRVLGMYTSGVDAWQRAKPVGARVSRVRPNTDSVEVVASAAPEAPPPAAPARSNPEHKQSRAG